MSDNMKLFFNSTEKVYFTNELDVCCCKCSEGIQDVGILVRVWNRNGLNQDIPYHVACYERRQADIQTEYKFLVLKHFVAHSLPVLRVLPSLKDTSVFPYEVWKVKSDRTVDKTVHAGRESFEGFARLPSTSTTDKVLLGDKEVTKYLEDLSK